MDRAPQVDFRRVLATMNAHRQRYQAPPLVIADVLQRYAQAWADRGEFRHSGGRFGENLALSYKPDATQACLEAIAMWQAEEKVYNYSRPGFSGQTGHFTQQCWAASRRVWFGVGRVTTGQWRGTWLVVASFDPPGNYAGQFPANVRRPRALLEEDDAPGDEYDDGFDADDEAEYE